MIFKLDEVIADHYGPRTAATYDQVAFEKFWAYPEALNAVATDLVWSRTWLSSKKSVSLLDIGAGTGNLSRAVIQELISRSQIENEPIEIHLTLFDESRHMLEQAVKKVREFDLKSCEVVIGRLQEGQWGGEYDAIISSFAIHHLNPTEKEKCIEGVFRSLSPGGVVSLLDKMWFDSALGPVSENNFLRVAASKFYAMAKKNHPDLRLEDVAETIRQGFIQDGDQPSSLESHLRWFHRAGFVDVQNPFTSFAAAVVSAQRPNSGFAED